MPKLNIKKGVSTSSDSVTAVQELAVAIQQVDAAIVIFFASSRYNLAALAGAMKTAFTCPVIGCTTSGEITSDRGYGEGSLIGMSLSSSELIAHPKLIASLAGFGLLEGEKLAQNLRTELQLSDDFDADKMFALLLVDGMSMLEEQVTTTLFNALGRINLIGGSAGDDLSFNETRVYWQGEFLNNAAIVTVFETTLPFKAFQIQHFEPTDIRLVITESDGDTRTVTEINAGPAAEEYAKAVGVELTALTQQVFASHPVMLKIGGKYYVRSIQKVNPDGSLTFFCAIDSGLVLTVGRGIGLIENLQKNMLKLQQEMPSLKITLGCDCVLRKLELQQKDLTGQANATLRDIEFFGFSTYGEQLNGIHMNQTLTGIAIGE